ncbi:MAG: S-layer homology domain-containing protein [Bacillota bacterium]
MRALHRTFLFMMTFIFFAGSPALAAGAPPSLPAAYWGTVKYTDGSSVAAGTVEAVIEGAVCGSIGFQNGSYGDPGTGLKLVVQGERAAPGKTVSFRIKVNGQVMAAAETTTWQSGDVRQVNLTVSPAGAPPLETPGSGGVTPPGGGTSPGGGETPSSGNGTQGGGGSSGGGSPGGKTTPGAAGVIELEENTLKGNDLQKAIKENPAASTLTLSLAAAEGKASLFIKPEALDTLNQSGKILAVEAGNVTVRIPAAAVKKEAIEKLAAGAGDAQARLSIAGAEKTSAGNFLVAGLTCAKVLDFSLEVEAAGSVKGKIEKFDVPVTISIKLTPAELAGLNPELLGVYYLNTATGKAEYLGGRFDPTSSVITFLTAHFSRFAVMEYKKVFADVPAGHWAAGDIQVMAARRVLGGVSETSFAPEDNVTRAQFAAMLVRALGLSTAGATVDFKDVTRDRWYYRDVAAAFQAGLVSGYDAYTFAPEDTITREQIAAMLVRALDRLGKTPVLREGEADTILASYQDRTTISNWAMKSAALAVKADLVRGRRAGTFVPQGTATRAEGAVLLKRFMQAAGLL